MDILNKFREFMQDRYGYDKLGLYIIITSIILSFLSRLFFLWPLNWLSIILDVIFIYRFLSKKEYARSRENRIFLDFLEKAKDFFAKNGSGVKYYRCPVCKTRFTRERARAASIPPKRFAQSAAMNFDFFKGLFL